MITLPLAREEQVQAPLAAEAGQTDDAPEGGESEFRRLLLDEAGAAYARELGVWRQRRGLSKRALAGQMGYDRTYVSHIEGGTLAPTEAFTRLAEDVLKADGALWRCWERWLSVRADTLAAGPPGVSAPRWGDVAGQLALVQRQLEDVARQLAVLTSREAL